MKRRSLINNAIYNLIYISLNLLFPLITAPYVSRILGASNLGKVNLAAVTVNWFILFSTFGVAVYGVREVAKIRHNKDKLSFLFSELLVINGVLSLLATIMYFIIVFNVKNFYDELPLYLLMSLSIILNMFSIDWFYQGIENYRYITIRNAILKLISLIGIFLFVKGHDDYILYGLISVLSSSLSGVLNYIYARKIVYIKFRKIKPIRHLKKLSVFFIHSFIVNIYTSLDQLLLGFFEDTKSVAFMNRTKILINMGIAFSTAISNVTLPRASYYREVDETKFKDFISKIPNYILWVTLPITVLYIILSPNIMYILGGDEFLEASTLLRIMALTIILSPLSGFLQNQVLVVSGKEKIGLIISIITSIVSVILNFIFIPSLGYVGAGIVQVIAEFSAVGIRYFIVRRRFRIEVIKFINRSILSYILSALIMGFIVSVVNHYIVDILISFVSGVIVGIFAYISLLILLRESVTNFAIKKFINMIIYSKRGGLK